MFCGFFKPKFYRECKYSIKFFKIRLDFMRRRKNAMVHFLKTDIVEILKTGNQNDDKAYKKVEELLEELRIISCYDLIERFCDCISSNLSLMQKQRECPEECREAVSSLIYATAWIHKAPELKDLRALFTRRYGNSIDSSVNRELVEKLVWRRPSREVRVQTLLEIAQESNIRWDPMSLLLKQTSSLQMERKETSKVETGADDPSIQTVKSIADDGSEDESVLSQSWRRDSFSNSSLSSSSSSSWRRRASVKKKKKIFPYGLTSPPYTKPGARNDEKAQEERKSVDQENSRLLKPQGNDNESSSTRENNRMSSFQRAKILDYDEVVDRLAALRRR